MFIRRNSTLAAFLLAGFSLSFNALADSAATGYSTYHFAGQCGTQGSWTAAALEQTGALRNYITKVKDDPNCKVLGTTIQNTLTQVEQELSTMKSAGAPEVARSNLPAEIGALSDFAHSTTENRPEVLQVLTKKLVEQSVVSNQGGGHDNPDASIQELAALRQRASRAGVAGLTMLNGTLDSLPKVQECLADNNAFGHFLAGTIKLVGAFASSNQDPSGTALATAVSKITNYAREAKYEKALAKLGQNEFMAALACLLEVTSESYCTARDGKIVFDDMMSRSQVVAGEDGKLVLQTKDVSPGTDGGDRDHPLEGYYVLTQNVPQITNWLQTIQIGVEPRMPTDSIQKGNVLMEITQYYTSVFNLQGTYNSGLATLKEYKNLAEKQNQVLNMVLDLAALMTDHGRGNMQNFFTIAYQDIAIPFMLLGMDIPDAVKGTQVSGSGYQQTPAAYLKANYLSMTMFQTPDVLADTIKVNMDRIINLADASALAYYNKWFVIDKVAIVDRAIVGHLYNVRESLIEVRSYLNRLADRIQKFDGDQIMLVGVRDTITRTDKVLATFDALDQYAHGLTNLSNTDAVSGETLRLSEELIREVYEQYFVMLAKSGFLANRMSDFVQYDFNLMQRSGVDLTPYLEEVYLATGRSMVNNILSMSAGSPANVNQDLAMALRVNKGNIEAIETALGTSYLYQVGFLQHIVLGYRHLSPASMDFVLNRYGKTFPIDAVPGNFNNPLWLFTESVSGELFSIPNIVTPVQEIANLVGLGDSLGAIPPQTLSPDDEFHSAERIKDQLCIQTLAFNNLNPFWRLCKTAELKSPFPYPTPDLRSNLPNPLAGTLDVKYKEKAWEHYDDNRELNHSLRICGLRDFNRKNLVLYLLEGQTRQ